MWTKGAASPSRSPSSPKNFARACPSCCRPGQYFGVWKAGKTRHILPVHRRDGRRHMPSGAGQSPQIEKNRKADMTMMVMSAFFDGSLSSAKGQPQSGGPSAPATTTRCRGTRKASFSGPAEKACRRSSRSPSLHEPFPKKVDREGHREPPIPASGLTRHDEEEEGSVACAGDSGYRQQGQWPPVSQSCFISRFPGYRRPWPHPHRTRGRPWRNGGYGAA